MRRHKQPFRAVGKIGVRLDLCLGRLAKSSFGDGACQYRARSALTQMPRPGSLAATSGTIIAVGADDKADERVFGQHFARDDAAAFARARAAQLLAFARVIGDAARLSRSAFLRGFAGFLGTVFGSSAGSSGNSSIQPIFTRAFMMMALASSAVRSKPSSAPGMRTRSLSLLTS